MRIIKSYFIILLMFSGAAYAQPGSRVVYSSKYLRAPGFIADSSFKAPSDTTVNKTGFAVKGTTAYIGDGVKWTAITGGSSTPEWGTITGDLDAQTDLNAALLAKKDVADSGRGVSQYVTGATLNKVRDSLQGNILLKLNISDTAAMMKRDTSSVYLLSDFSTSSVTAVSTGLNFQIAANAVYTVIISGTASKATTTSGMKLAIGAPTGCTIKGQQQHGTSSLSTAMQNGLITAINTLGTTFATGAGVEVPFRIEATITNGSTAGVISLDVATVTSNAATIYAGTRMVWHKAKGL